MFGTLRAPGGRMQHLVHTCTRLMTLASCATLLLLACAGAETDDPPGSVGTSGSSRFANGGDLPVDAHDAVASFGVSRSVAGQRVADYLHTMDSDTEPTKKLAQLRLDVDESAAELVKSYRSIAQTRRIDRWKVVHTLGQLRTERALEDLKSIAFEPVPAPAAPKMRGDGAGSEADPTYAQEMMIRARAVEGIEILAREGNQTAERALLDVVSAPALSARRAAAQAYLRLPWDQQRHRDDLAAVLVPAERWMLELKEVPTSYFNGPPPPALPSAPPKNPTSDPLQSSP